MIDTTGMKTEALEAYDDMMVECVVKVDNFAGIASLVWTDVLKELDKRGRVKLASGSYDNIGDALIHRIR